MYEIEFKGYWSDREKEIWNKTNWKDRDYKDLPIEEDTFQGIIYFYGINSNVVQKSTTFVKYIRSNPIYPPYYGPIISSELYDFIKTSNSVGPMYDGRHEGNYDIHDRYESNDLYDVLSR